MPLQGANKLAGQYGPFQLQIEGVLLRERQAYISDMLTNFPSELRTILLPICIDALVAIVHQSIGQSGLSNQKPDDHHPPKVSKRPHPDYTIFCPQTLAPTSHLQPTQRIEWLTKNLQTWACLNVPYALSNTKSVSDDQL